MGGHKTLILEFPFPEMLMALGYRVFGYDMGVARLVTLLFFAGSAAYLFLIVARVASRQLAAVSTAVYLVMPLSLFYSRAVEIDFFAVFFAHAMTYHLLRALESGAPGHLVLGTAAATMAFLVKAPYAFYLFLPLGVFAWRRPRVPSALMLGTAVSASVAAFFIWRAHANSVNSGAPDWSFIPGYFKFVNMGGWYYGPLHMRWDPQVWWGLALRFHQYVATPFGSVLFVAGLVASARAAVEGAWCRVAPLWAWLVGVLAYVAIFLNLNVVHVYYQIPLLAVTAVFIAIAIDVPRELSGQRHRATGLAASLVLFTAFAGGAVATAERNFYKDEGVRIEAGEVIRRHTPPGSLIVGAEDSPDTDCRDPRLLFLAQRYGRAISKRDLTSDLLKRYRGIGADYLAVLSESATGSGEFQWCPMVGYPLGHRPWVVHIAEPAQCRGTAPGQTP